MKDDRTGLDGLPETERTRIEALADRAQKDWSNPWQTPRKSHPETCPYRRDALNACTCRGAYDAAIVREVAAYRAAHPDTPGSLTRAQAEEQLRAGGMTEPAIVHVLHYAPHAADLADLSTSPTVRAILRAYVRGQDVAGVGDAELAALASAQIADTGYRLDHIEPGDRDHVAQAVMVKTGHDDPIRSPLFRRDTEPLLCLAQRLAREVCGLRGMLAARAPATRVTGVRTATGMREELNEFAEQAWRDGTTIETFTDIREEPDVIGDALRAMREHLEGDDEPALADLCDLVNRAAEEHAAAVEDLEDLHEAQHAAAMSAERIIRDKQAEIERLTTEIAQKGNAIALLQAERESENEALRRLTAELAARAPERDASRPTPADEDTRPRLTERDADDIELARAVRDTLREVTHAGAIERLEELLDVEKEAAARPGLTEEQAQIARAEPIIAAWLDYFAAMDRQHESGSAEDARIVRDLRAKAEAMYRGGPDIVYFVALARHRASQGEAGATFSPSPVRWKNGKLASRGETGPAAEVEPFEKIEQLPSGLTRTMHAAAQRPSTPPDLGPAPYRTTLAIATTADDELRVTATSLRITVTDLGSVAHDPRSTLRDGDPQKSGGNEQ